MKNYNYGIIGNCSTAALISTDGSIDWLCLPFFDSPSVFGRLLDEKKGGYFKVTGVDTIETTQNYIPNTPILKTVITTKDGVIEIRDYMPRFLNARGQAYCPSEIHRDILVISGRPKIRIELAPRPNYAASHAEFLINDDYIKITSTEGEYNSFYLYTNFDQRKLIDGEPLVCEGSSYILISYHEKLEKIDKDRIYLEYEKTKSYWLDWVSKLRKVKETYRALVIRSMITLKLLMYEKTGAVIAAPTASLPEIIGKERNWDYRYCWIRDASMIIDLYARMGDMRTASRFMEFILNRMLLKHENIAVMYGINGEKDLTERVLDHLDGYEGSRPVRVGNEAYIQQQNDVYGELIEAIYAYFVANRRRSFMLDEEIWTVVRSLVRDAISVWKKPDSGIWERRQDLGHYVHSKFMCWVALDRAAKIARFIGKETHAKRWVNIADDIKEDILKNGYDQELNSFVMSYGSKSFDASNLLMLHYGFLDNKDPRIVSTVNQTYEHLVKDNFIHRYTERDEFGDSDNAFIVCIFWMINALYLIGEEEKARGMFDNILSCLNPHGLLSEDIELASRRLTGNFPQGYSHLALVQTVLLLETDYSWTDRNTA